ncbi:hypothetical protein LTS18_011355, partial [Coniosporium uncinatum]
RGFANPAPLTESAREARKSFFCTLCQKGYSRINELETHESSYDHTHRKRRKDLDAMQRDPNAASKAREAERRADERAGVLAMKPIQLASGGAGGGVSGGGFKKGGFRNAFAAVGGGGGSLKKENAGNAAVKKEEDGSVSVKKEEKKESMMMDVDEVTNLGEDESDSEGLDYDYYRPRRREECAECAEGDDSEDEG